MRFEKNTSTRSKLFRRCGRRAGAAAGRASAGRDAAVAYPLQVHRGPGRGIRRPRSGRYLGIRTRVYSTEVRMGKVNKSVKGPERGTHSRTSLSDW